jgi:hypothetical protein
MPIDSKFFLDVYAKALNTFDPKNVISFCIPPTFIINDKTKKVITSEGKLVHVFRQIFLPLLSDL